MPSINEIKSAVRARDGFRCTQCGMSNEEHLQKTGRSLEVHRLTPGSPYTMEGCKTLCRRCHGSKPKRAKGTFDLGHPGKQQVMFRVTEKLYERVKETARGMGLDVANFLRYLMTRHIHEYERRADQIRQAD